MICQHRMRDHLHVAFGHVASSAVVSRSLALPDHERERAAFFSMTREAFLPVVGGSILARRLHVRVVTANATQMTATAAIALAEPHRKVVFEKIRLRRIAPRRDH